MKKYNKMVYGTYTQKFSDTNKEFLSRLSEQQHKNITWYLSLVNNDNRNGAMIKVEFFYQVSYHTDRYSQNHIIAMNVIFPCIKDPKCVLGEHVWKMNSIPF